MNTEFGYLPVGFPLLLYYLIISLIGVGFFVFMKKDKFSILLFLIFFGGVLTFWGDIIDNIYKIILVGFTIILLIDKKNKYFDITTIAVFFLFTIVFFYSTFSNKNPFFYSFSQYSKFLVPFLISIFIINNLESLKSNLYYLNFILMLILLQVLFSVIKFFTIGFSESVVGSAAFMGGNPATFLPILGLIIVYAINNGNLKFRDIILLSSMFLISILSFKRIIWFIYPIVVISLNLIWGRTKYLKYILILGPLIFYLGVRLNPSLNKEFKIWGSFDFMYALEYAQEYSGLGSAASSNTDPTSGRFAGNSYLIKYIGNNIDNYKTWFGSGPKSIYGTSYEDYQKGKGKWGVTDKGSLSGAGRFLIAYGLLGLLLYLLLIFLFFYKNHNKKFRLFIIIFFLLEFFLYLDTLILPFLMIPLLLISNYLSISSTNDLLIALSIYKNESNN